MSGRLEMSGSDAIARSAVEALKESSRYLRGNIVAELDDGTDHVSKESYNLLKFHGTYQQEDRDARKARDRAGVGKHYMFMVRCRLPGGKLTAGQYLALDDLAGRYANGTIRLTTRQGIQFHGVLKGDLRATIAGINQCLLTTLGACGDVERNVMCCPAPVRGVRDQLQQAADALAAHLAPRSRAYHEIWLNGQAVSSAAGDDHEPIYGRTYLPRKFKTGIGLPGDNCIDVYAQDLGLLPELRGEEVVGYNLLVGGGMGMTHGKHETFPHLAQPICWVPARDLLPAAEAVVKLFRDHGNRADRKRARIKYLVHDWGVPRFREMLAGYLPSALVPPRPILVQAGDLHLGWRPQGDGRSFLGLSVESGRIKDSAGQRLRTALREVVRRFQPALRVTPSQDLLLCDLAAGARAEVEAILKDHGVRLPDELSPARRLALACPAIPTCGLALSESERALPGVLDGIEAELRRLGLGDEPLSVRMTGCPNGCARPYQSDIGIVGRSGDKYSLFVGGRPLGDRLNFLLRDLVPLHRLVPTLTPLLEAFRDGRRPGEGFGDFCQRLGREALLDLLPPEVQGKPA
jgi:sulfite reductase (ferredoxin)